MQDVNRTIVISSPIDSQVAGQVIAMIEDVNNYDEWAYQNVVNYEAPEIRLIMNSGGGEAASGFAIVGAIETSETPVAGIAMGMIASVALAILASCHVRVSQRHTRFMYHSVAYGTEGHIADHQQALEEGMAMQRMYDALISERTQIPAERMKRSVKSKKDLWMTAEEALEYGIIEAILPKPDYSKYVLAGQGE